MANTFHLAILAGDLEEAIEFYCNVLGCKKGNSEINPPDSWCDIDFWGNELTLHASCGGEPRSEGHNVDMGNVQVPHFGVHLDPDIFEALKIRLISNEDIKFVEEPFIRFKSDILEQETMFIEDPNGNVLELKTMVNPDALFITKKEEE
tara:strand:+ start:1847 stop:2293 length:447 start_codon:yes stop_codon:yes gene_type:complete